MIQEVITADALRPFADEPEDTVLQPQRTFAEGLIDQGASRRSRSYGGDLPSFARHW